MGKLSQFDEDYLVMELSDFIPSPLFPIPHSVLSQHYNPALHDQDLEGNRGFLHHSD
jgi:hypothetical protein